MPEQIVCVRDTKVTKFSGFATFVEKIEKVELVYWIVADYIQRTKILLAIACIFINPTFRKLVKQVQFFPFNNILQAD